MKKLDSKTIENAFDDIKLICDNAQFDEEFSIYEEYQEQFDIVEDALKELQERREMMQKFNEASVPSVIDDDTYKKAKALEIIIEMINNDKIVDRLNANSQKIIKALFNDLSKEKQDLLKEVLA